MIDVLNLCFEYQGKPVLRDVSFHIAQNSVVALVGPNGAGKTTLLRCLVALHEPVSGRVLMNRIDTIKNPRAVHRCSGYLSDFFGLYDNLTVRQNLRYIAWCQNLSKNETEQRIQDVSRDTDIQEYLDKKASVLSRGYRQRLGVALAILHKPKILLLDEPASGMDPEARISLSDLILRLKDMGMTIVVSSHILAELEDYCTDMLVIRNGEVHKHIIRSETIQEEVFIVAECLEIQDSYASFVSKQTDVDKVRIVGGAIEIIHKGDEKSISQLLKAMIVQEIPVVSFEVKRQSLQRAYMDLAQKHKYYISE